LAQEIGVSPSICRGAAPLRPPTQAGPRIAIIRRRRHEAGFAHLLALLAAFLVFPALTIAQKPLEYRLEYNHPKSPTIHISLRVPGGVDAPLILIIPRTVPGGYAQRPYDPFVENVHAFSLAGASLEVHREQQGPRWKIGKIGDRFDRVEYDVNLSRMEHEILVASDSSKVRDGYAGLLGYSIFAFLLGRENEPVRLEVTGPSDWPVFSTLAPQVPATVGSLTASAPDYYALADSQIVMGPGLQLQRIEGSVPLFLAVYAETEDDLSEEGALARDALDKMTAYFGKAPFSHYTVQLELLRPVSERHEYGFSMEHLESGTFYFGVDRAITSKSDSATRQARRFNYAHHMAHSWIPKRAYGAGYLPFEWEAVPLIDTIWFNEGFARYAVIEAFAEAMPKEDGESYRQRQLAALRKIVDEAPPFIRKMSLLDLSREGSFLYSEDFRIGMNLFSRGALMAAEMDDRIRARTQQKKSLRDALRYLLDWSEKNRRAFRVEELPVIFREATGVDTRDILDRRLQPLDR
jgi:predicted metalloprotease with PDZ domain